MLDGGGGGTRSPRDEKEPKPEGPPKDGPEPNETLDSALGGRNCGGRNAKSDPAVANEKPVHYHLDQQVNPNERGTEALINAIQRSALRERIVALGADEPLVWVVHCISPSTYARTRRETLATKMAELRVGLVCCPSAALSMRTLSIFDAPVHKSIADVLLLLDHGVIVRLGTDNVDDIFLPATVLDPRREVATLADALRFYHVAILAKIACGKALSVEERDAVASHLEHERQYVASLRGVGPFPFEV